METRTPSGCLKNTSWKNLFPYVPLSAWPNHHLTVQLKTRIFIVIQYLASLAYWMLKELILSFVLYSIRWAEPVSFVTQLHRPALKRQRSSVNCSHMISLRREEFLILQTKYHSCILKILYNYQLWVCAMSEERVWSVRKLSKADSTDWAV